MYTHEIFWKIQCGSGMAQESGMLYQMSSHIVCNNLKYMIAIPNQPL